MRLLFRSDTGKVNLTKDLVGDDPIPPYAILSHTWGADTDEVTFEDLKSGTGEDKPGYKKIRFCGEQAREDNLQYFWVDTCCINKADSTELSRAINSMFRWYHNATRCYVYLSDVSSLVFDISTELNPQPWESDFRKSKWFKRGWTLQELLAPSSVVFFSQERKRLGDKISLQQQIREITGIPDLALRGAALSEFNVDVRLSWIKGRQTKLEEDKAYSLLGIFDVYIPLIYGEGEANALKRLRDVINKDQECIQHLRPTDPRDDKKRIEETKGGLLKDSYHWILSYPDFQQWRNDQQSRLLWIKGDPGKGKTMLLCGIINELNKSKAKINLAYFFCQATDSRINNATAVLRGLMYLLVDQQPSLISHIRKTYDHAGKSLFEDANAWVALSEIFTNMMQDLSLNSTYLVIDALDECETGLPKLLQLLVRSASTTPQVKWIISSRNKLEIEQQLKLDDGRIKLSLELNADHVSHAVDMYINYKVSQLLSVEEDSELQERVRNQMREKANGTFLWVALVFPELENVDSWDVLEVLEKIPAGLPELYDRMMRQVQQLQGRTREFCRLVLSTITLVYRPLHLLELRSLSGLPDEISKSLDSVAKIISKCGSFLTIRDSYIYFVHQSAKDYLDSKELSEFIFPTGRHAFQFDLLSRTIQVMSQSLQRDIYKLRLPGISIDSVQVPVPDLLAPVRYSCVYWARHFQEAYESSLSYQRDLTDGGEIHRFLQGYFLYWLEALSLLREIPMGVLAIYSLETYILADKSPKLHAFVHDAKRFTLSNRSVIEQAPLQLYCSALLFAPEKSIVRRQFEKNVPGWMEMKSKRNDHWSATLSTLEGHSSSVRSVAFSPDGKTLASGSDDSTVRLWDAGTGAALSTLEGHSDCVRSVAFSPDGKTLASGSWDSTVRLWDAGTGAALSTLEGHSGYVRSVAFSPDGKTLASGSDDSTVRLWDAGTGAALSTLEGHSGCVRSVAFSPDGKTLASGSYDSTVRLWDAGTGAALSTLEGHSDCVRSVAFSPDGKTLASGSWDSTVRLWDAGTGAALSTLVGHSGPVTSVAFSPDGGQLITNRGVLDIGLNISSDSSKHFYALSASNDWVMEAGENILWLPPDFRATCVAVWNGTVVLGHSSGSVSFLYFSQGSKLL